jgi:tRNA dimethylallyltransferase
LTPGPTHLALVGPTASGKSGLALLLAQELGDIEIVSIDSMQVYRGMDVGTAKATTAERAAVAHHMIDIADPGDDFSVARFQAEARAAVADIEARGLRALLVGGTGLYVQAVVDDLRFPGEDLALRAELEAATEAPGGVASAYTELTELDPVAAARIDPHNARRIVRALEVIRLTGERFSSFGAGIASFGATAFPVLLTGLWLPRAVLAKRIDVRVEAMRRSGLMDEVRALRGGPGLSRNARQAIGYREALGHLDGTSGIDEAFAMTGRRTRSFARRQRMWFRRDPRITWLAAPENPCDVAGALLALWRR